MGGGGGTDCWIPLRQALLVMAIIASCFHLQVVAWEHKFKRAPVIFNFGDSNSDTGGFSAGMGNIFGDPEGRAFFHRPTGRMCDGRLIIDFLCQSIGTGTLRPYLDAVGITRTNFTNGANFAIVGASALPPSTPFNLLTQVLQFLRFRTISLDLAPARHGQLLDHPAFDTALYTIDIGQNDLTAAFLANNMTYDQIVSTTVPATLLEIKNNMLNLYANGARRFWVHNTGPLGCLPASMTLPGVAKVVDSVGCMAQLNDASRAFNAGLAKMCDQLRAQLAGATVVYVDVFAIKYDVFANASRYGFDGPPLMACCGNGGPPYNFDRNMLCPTKGVQVCPETSKYLSWDGVHYTEAANSIFAAKIMSGNYSDPPLSFRGFCDI